MALNVPFAATIFGDYACMAFLTWFCYTHAANDKLDAWTGGLSTLSIIVVSFLRETIYWLFFTPIFARAKTDFRLYMRPDFYLDILRSIASIVALGSVCCHFGLMHCRWSTGILSAIFEVSRDYWMMSLLKDNTSMRFIHPWMHKPENYWMHKRHHAGNKNTSILHGYVIDLTDLIIEFLIGSVLAMAVNKVVFGDPSVHLLSFIFLGWTDSSVHSENPYTQAIGNPLLDYIFKPNIVHNLHHAYPTNKLFMTVYPLHHISASKRNEDVQKYNSIMKTNVQYSLFI